MPAPKANCDFKWMREEVANLLPHPNADLVSKVQQAPENGACSFAGGFAVPVKDVGPLKHLWKAAYVTEELMKNLSKVTPGRADNDAFIF